MKTKFLSRKQIVARLAAASCLLLALLPLAARGEIIVDDFDDAFEIALPEMADQDFQQFGVGDLDAMRTQGVSAIRTEPIGHIDADLTQSSALTFAIQEINPTSTTLLPVIGLNLRYTIDETDITQGGINDRLVLDFAYLQSELPLSRINVFLVDASDSGTSYVSHVFDLLPNEGPFSLEFPFDTFGPRGGSGSLHPDFTRTTRISVTISPLRFIDFDELKFATAIERIRITHAVPEPTSFIGTALCTVSTWFLWSLKRSNDDEDRSD